jgi:hypothetical protein
MHGVTGLVDLVTVSPFNQAASHRQPTALERHQRTGQRKQINLSRHTAHERTATAPSHQKPTLDQ